MTPTQYREAIAEIGLSQGKAAKLLGVSLSASKRYALGKTGIHPSAARLLRLIRHMQLVYNDDLEKLMTQ